MKIIIGITQEPAKLKEFLFQHYGQSGSLTEVGPFLSKMDALNWLVYLKSVIGEFEEIIPELQSGKDSIWYGFAYESVGDV
ncbi:hypothetical protein [Desulfosediminicola sp.]|uniref:hypothetical protein n=1 Tax=Desulfosediminicola sp. TaxID=2886825 RepID=UPI003AF2829D